MKKYIGKKKVARVYINNQDKYRGEPLWETILLKAKEYGLAGATVFKGVAGMGAHSEVHSFNVLVMSQVLPLVIELIDDEERVRSFLDEIEPMMEEGLTSMSDVEVITYKHK